MAEETPQDPPCDNCGEDKYLITYNNNNFCHKCWNSLTRDAGKREHETQEWHDRLDRVLKGKEEYRR